MKVLKKRELADELRKKIYNLGAETFIPIKFEIDLKIEKLVKQKLKIFKII